MTYDSAVTCKGRGHYSPGKLGPLKVARRASVRARTHARATSYVRFAGEKSKCARVGHYASSVCARTHPRIYPSSRVFDVSICYHTYTHLFHRNASCNLLAIRLSDCELSPRTRYIDLVPSPLYLTAIKMNFAPRRRERGARTTEEKRERGRDDSREEAR